MPSFPRLSALVAAWALIALAAACGASTERRSTVTPNPGTSGTSASGAPSSTGATGAATPSDALARTRASLADGYTITVTAANFVLPQWGGSESGTVEVGAGGTTASAHLRRTGEDSFFDIRFVEGQTFFKRGTCDTWARVPGGGADVLKPFLVAATNVLATAQNPQFVAADNRVVVDATIDGLGRALIQMEPETYKLVTIVFGDKPDNAGHTGFTFDFSDLGKALSVEKPSGDIPDRGPGGAPC